MNLKFWQKKEVPNPLVEVKQSQDKASATMGADQALINYARFGTSSASTPTGCLRLYETSSAVAAPVNIIADAFSSLVPVLEIDGETVKQHPVLELLSVPSPFYSRELFLEVLGKHFLTTGGCYIGAVGSLSSAPAELQPISPAEVQVQEGSSGYAASMRVSGQILQGNYTYLRKSLQRVQYVNGNLKELKQIRTYSTKNSSILTGQSPLLAALKEVELHIAGNEHNKSLLTRGGKLSMSVINKGELAPAEYQEFKERVQAEMAGFMNAGHIFVGAGSDLDIQHFGTTNKDMDFALLQAESKKAIASMLKVPLALITTEASSYNNYRESKLALYDDAVLPLADRIFAGLSDFLLPRFKLDPRVARITYDTESITALAIRRNEELKLRKELDLETTNELRAMIGLDAKPGGDNLSRAAGYSGAPQANPVLKPKPTASVLRDKL